jgi:tetratricopeptide (TPR) repeat protein
VEKKGMAINPLWNSFVNHWLTLSQHKPSAFATYIFYSPLRPLTWVNGLAWAYLGNKQYDKAIQLWTEGIERNPNYLFAYQGLTAAYELSGNHEKALWAAENVMRINPNISIAALEKK